MTRSACRRLGVRGVRHVATALVVIAFTVSPSAAQGDARAMAAPADPPHLELTAPVNDFANVIDPAAEEGLDRMIRALQAASGDVVVVATIPTVQPYADIREYAVKLFENAGRGIGQKGKDNGLLILVAPNDRRVWVEVGYGLEEWITDGFAGETSRDYMAPEFRNGRYGAGLVAGTSRIIARIAQGRGVTLTGVELPNVQPLPTRVDIPLSVVVMLFVAMILLSRILGGPGRRLRGRRSRDWNGWSGGVGPFGTGWGGPSRGGGGFGGGFGGFGGGRSGGGGGGAGW
jgi:uncharacterized protein